VLRKLEVLALIAFLGLSTFSFADQVTLKNGDRLTGTVVKSDGKELVLHTDAAGDVTGEVGERMPAAGERDRIVPAQVDGPARQAGVIVKDEGDGGAKAAGFLAGRKFI